MTLQRISGRGKTHRGHGKHTSGAEAQNGFRRLSGTSKLVPFPFHGVGLFGSLPGILTILTVLFFGTELHAAPTVVCGAAVGTQFDLEPNSHAVPQQLEAVDFIPNRVGLNEDLVVGGAYDFRGGGLGSPPPKGVIWDGSVSGYYVHRSTKADCSPQFEGGLPPIVSGATTYLGNGGVAIAADPAGDAFFVADLRFGAADNVSAVGLFRASSATLLNANLCPNGTHTAAQAKTCWEATPAVVLDPNPPGGLTATIDSPSVTVDERASNVGAGDVYVAFGKFNVSAGGIALVACTNFTLSCSTPIIISSTSPPFGSVDAHVQVRPDGNITVTYVDQNSAASNTIHFVMCTPSGAPKAPVCSAPTVVANENQALAAGTFGSLSGLNLPVFTAARHSDRLEADGKTVTTFVVWDRCKTLFPNSTTCLNAQVVLSTSTDNGKTWSAPKAVNSSAGHQFFPWISTDASTGTVNIVYYNTAPDLFHKRVVVSLNQIAAGSTTVGPPISITTSAEPWDADPTQNPFAIGFDFHFGMKARGMGTPGFSRVYTSFTSTGDRPGVYSGQPLPEQNNNLQKVVY
jgi:hypothetical protein